jgi:hypothetical protein
MNYDEAGKASIRRKKNTKPWYTPRVVVMPKTYETKKVRTAMTGSLRVAVHRKDCDKELHARCTRTAYQPTKVGKSIIWQVTIRSQSRPVSIFSMPLKGAAP